MAAGSTNELKDVSEKKNYLLNEGTPGIFHVYESFLYSI